MTSSPRGIWRRFAPRLLLAVAALVASLALAEVAVRLLGIGPVFFFISRDTVQLSDNPELGYEPRPGAQDDSERVSTAGLRDREFDIDKPQGVSRIVIAGDSVTWGAGVSRDQAYPKRLEALLNDCVGRTAFEVMNLGVSGYNISQVVERIRVRGLPYKPDLVVYGYVLNDPMDYSVELETLEAMQADAEERLDRQASWLQRHSRLYALAVHGLRTQVAHRPLDRQQLSAIYNREGGWRSVRKGTHVQYFSDLHGAPESWGRVQQGLEKLGRVLDDSDIPGVVAIFPLRLAEGFPSYPLRGIHEKVGNEAQQVGLEVIDLLPPFAEGVGTRRGPRLFKDAFHPTVAGHELAAGALIEGLCRSPTRIPARLDSSWTAACRCIAADADAKLTR